MLMLKDVPSVILSLCLHVRTNQTVKASDYAEYYLNSEKLI